MQEAIFLTTGQALHVSYLIMSVEARQKNAFREVLMRIIESVELPSARLKAWYKELQGTRGQGTVNFEGLDPYEVRAQCAMVTQTVKDHLPDPEMHVVHARFIPTTVTNGGDKRIIHYSPDRAAAIKYLSARVLPHFPKIKGEAMDYLVAKIYANHKLTTISFRAIAHDFGGDHMIYARAFPKVKGMLYEIEQLAMSRLDDHFKKTYLVERVEQFA
jgi:hypothetical protein